MQELLDKLTLEQLKDEPRELAETIGLDAFKRLVSAYGGSGHLYVPTVSKITAPVRNQRIYKEYTENGISIYKIALKYGLSEAYVRQIIQAFSKSEK